MSKNYSDGKRHRCLHYFYCLGCLWILQMSHWNDGKLGKLLTLPTRADLVSFKPPCFVKSWWANLASRYSERSFGERVGAELSCGESSETILLSCPKSSLFTASSRRRFGFGAVRMPGSREGTAVLFVNGSSSTWYSPAGWDFSPYNSSQPVQNFLFISQMDFPNVVTFQG